MAGRTMALNATVEEAATIVAEGEFDGEVPGVQEKGGRHGSIVLFEFRFCTDGEWDGRRVSGLERKKLSAATKLGRWVEAILGPMPGVGEEVTAKDLLNKQCRVEIKHRTSPDGTVFANVVEVLPVNETRV